MFVSHPIHGGGTVAVIYNTGSCVELPAVGDIGPHLTWITADVRDYHWWIGDYILHVKDPAWVTTPVIGAVFIYVITADLRVKGD